MSDSTTGKDGFRRSFVIDVAPDTVWRAVTGAPAEAKDDGTPQYHMAGFEALCSVIEEDPGTLLRLRKEEEPCSGTEIAVQLEHAGSGTRVTVVQSGFGPWLPDVIEMFGMVWNMIVADLKLYLEQGVRVKTHLFDQAPPRASLGCETQDRLEGLAVGRVAEDGFAGRAGLRTGDLLLQLNGVRLLNTMQLIDLMRIGAPGTELEAVWARSGELMRATVPL